MTSRETKEGKVPVGFAGMTSMVSDVEARLAEARRQATAAVAQPPDESVVPPPPRIDLPARLPLQSTASVWGFVHWWYLGALGLFVFGTMLFSEATKTSVSTPPASQATRTVVPAPLVPPGRTPEELSPPFQEDKPPVGKNHVLTRAQIQFCLAENIRLEAGQLLVHDTDDFRAVQRFNTLIDDYNSRCAEFRYQRSAMEGAKEAVERQRPTIQAQGVGRFPTTEPQPRPSSSHKADENRTQGSQFGLDSQHVLDKNAVLDRAHPSSANLDRFSDAETASGPTSPPRPGSRALTSPKHGIVPGDLEAVRNFQDCLDGRYPRLCKHEWLTPPQMEQVASAERAANLKQCLTADYPILCDHTLLTPVQAGEVEEAERREMFNVCLEGRYPGLCNDTVLTSAQRQAIRTARTSIEPGTAGN